jgi:hypothetical protein
MILRALFGVLAFTLYSAASAAPPGPPPVGWGGFFGHGVGFLTIPAPAGGAGGGLGGGGG